MATLEEIKQGIKEYDAKENAREQERKLRAVEGILKKITGMDFHAVNGEVEIEGVRFVQDCYNPKYALAYHKRLYTLGPWKWVKDTETFVVFAEQLVDAIEKHKRACEFLSKK